MNLKRTLRDKLPTHDFIPNPTETTIIDVIDPSNCDVIASLSVQGYDFNDGRVQIATDSMGCKWKFWMVRQDECGFFTFNARRVS